MGPLFSNLVEDALGEIDRRDPRYLPRFQISLPRGASRVDRYHQHPALKDHDHASLDQSVNKTIQYLEDRHLPLVHSDNVNDPASLIMFDAMLDAFAADQGLVPLRRAPQPTGPADEIFRN